MWLMVMFFSAFICFVLSLIIVYRFQGITTPVIMSILAVSISIITGITPILSKHLPPKIEARVSNFSFMRAPLPDDALVRALYYDVSEKKNNALDELIKVLGKNALYHEPEKIISFEEFSPLVLKLIADFHAKGQPVSYTPSDSAYDALIGTHFAPIPIIALFTFKNLGEKPIILEDFVISLSDKEREFIYTPVVIIDFEKFIRNRKDGQIESLERPKAPIILDGGSEKSEYYLCLIERDEADPRYITPPSA